MAFYILDSNAIIDFLKGVESALAMIHRLNRRGDTLCSCGVVVTEVTAGLPPGNRPAADIFLDGLTYLPTTEEAARQAGEWRYLYARQGVAISTTDALIAATAHDHGATIVTRNVRHYPMPELRVVSPDDQDS